MGEREEDGGDEEPLIQQGHIHEITLPSDKFSGPSAIKGEITKRRRVSKEEQQLQKKNNITKSIHGLLLCVSFGRNAYSFLLL